MNDLIKRAGLTDRVSADSAAARYEEIGMPLYPPAFAELKKHGIDGSGHRARKMRYEDYDRYDIILGMDHENMRDMHRLWPNDPAKKIHMLMDYTKRPGEVADPWYTGDFAKTWKDVLEGCTLLLETIKKGELLPE